MLRIVSAYPYNHTDPFAKGDIKATKTRSPPIIAYAIFESVITRNGHTYVTINNEDKQKPARNPLRVTLSTTVDRE